MNDLFRTFEISASGMYAQRLRMNTVASNLANYEAYKQTGEPFRKLEVVFQAIYNPDRVRKGEIPVAVTQIKESDAPFRVIYDPDNPRADAQGYVRLPNVDLVKEMADMISAVRSYEANLNAFNLTKEMANRTIELWR
ncbi:flagellar basal-body rod protein FlgC [Hydrogenivirga caldilitoris]|uniref:Flagellar basal-body rod protein FlgC n=1 Tax=Hydrogenivirga caldilitoris TaxID=246264 RepID=A0A497XRB4_9AQUI|nr:flagellar basal body rod protein FlgC [Hydrogenivirga caldilitoris]RLJ71468.1 flagellar basal-body rod protein FlgC [Hydrogenivirga caldilitoris]